MFTIEYLDGAKRSNVKTTNNLTVSKNLTSQAKSNVKNIHHETNEIVQAKKCLEVAKLLMQADRMVRKRICRKSYANKK